MNEDLYVSHSAVRTYTIDTTKGQYHRLTCRGVRARAVRPSYAPSRRPKRPKCCQIGIANDTTFPCPADALTRTTPAPCTHRAIPHPPLTYSTRAIDPCPSPLARRPPMHRPPHRGRRTCQTRAQRAQNSQATVRIALPLHGIRTSRLRRAQGARARRTVQKSTCLIVPHESEENRIPRPT